MTGCWVRGDNEDGMEWVEPVPTCPGEFYVTEPQTVCELLGPDGEPLIQIVDREPIGFRQRWT